MGGSRRRDDASAEDLLVVVELGPPHGIRGEIMGRLSGVTPEELMALPRLRLRHGSAVDRPVKIASARPKKGDWILEIGLRDRTEAERYRGAEILAPRKDLPEPDPGEWYIADLVGLAVRTDAGEELGELVEVLTLPANDVAVVRGKRGEVLVPLLDHVIVELDPEAGIMTVALPAGLLEEDS
ncbi:ribosome maturation factor RimM [bacterium]|nr:ribosome maturation factor RimM [bacterium]